MSPTSAFGNLLNTYRARKHGLTLTRLANIAGYDKAILVRMGQGKKDLTGPSGRERVVRVIAVLHDEGAITRLDEANALLKSAGMSPLYEGQPAELALIQSLKAEPVPQAQSTALQNQAGANAAHPATNLPLPLNRFVGRRRDLVEVARLLGTTRLLTLTGSGGCGKTRLALEVGASLVGEMHRPLNHGMQAPSGGASPSYDAVWLVDNIVRVAQGLTLAWLTLLGRSRQRRAC